MGIIIKPIVTEKLTAQGEKLNRYGFIVDRKANKLEVKSRADVQRLSGISQYSELSREKKIPLYKSRHA